MVAGRSSCRSLHHSEKVKMEKGATPQPDYKKKKTITSQFAIVPTYHAHNDKDNREDRAD